MSNIEFIYDKEWSFLSISLNKEPSVFCGIDTNELNIFKEILEKIPEIKFSYKEEKLIAS